MKLTKCLSSLVLIAALFSVTPALADKIGDKVNAISGPAYITLSKATRRNGVVTVRAEGNKTERNCPPEAVNDVETSYLLDPETGTKYMILKDEKGEVLGASGLSACEEFSVYGKFPAPPTEVKTIDIVFQNFQPFENVSLTDE